MTSTKGVFRSCLLPKMSCPRQLSWGWRVIISKHLGDNFCAFKLSPYDVLLNIAGVNLPKSAL